MTKKENVEQPIDLAPFELLNNKEKWRHLLKFHTWQAHHRLSSTSRRDQYTDAHDKSHLQGENVKDPHTHTATAAATPRPEDPTAGADLANVDLSKPLNLTQRRALKDLVENDFLAMRAEIQQMADDAAADKRREITEEWAARGADASAFEDRGQKLMDRYRNDSSTLVAEARKAGVDLSLPHIKDSYPKLEAKVEGLNEALRAAERDIDADRKRALNALERSRLTAQRRVLLTGVTEEALSVLDTIPTAQALMLEAASQRTGARVLEGTKTAS